MRKSRFIIESIILAFITVLAYNALPVSNQGMIGLGILGIAQLLFSIYSWSKITGSALNPYIIFLVAAYTFTFGQSFLFTIDKVSPEHDLFSVFPADSIMPAQYLTLIFLNFFHIGGMLSSRRAKSNNKDFAECLNDWEEYNIQNQIYGIKKVGKLFLLISIIPYIIERVSIFILVLSYGYSGIYMQEARIGFANILSILSQYFIPGLLCLLLVETNKRKRNIYVIILAFEAAFWLFTGGRSNGVIIASILLMYYHICVKPIKFKQAIVVIVAGFLFVSLLGVISETRKDQNISASEVIATSFGDSNAFYSAISEMGGSMFPMITTMNLVPKQYDYKYGSSYLYALSSIIPNLGFWDLHPAMKYANMNAWLQDAMDLDYGPGYSIVAEAYVNFGKLGFLMMLLLGYCYGLIFCIDIKDKKNPIYLVLSFVFCFLVIKTVRNSFLATVRSLFYYIIPIYLIVVYYYKGRINSNFQK